MKKIVLKKKLIIPLILLVFIWIFVSNNIIILFDTDTCVGRFQYKDKDFEVHLSDEDAKVIIDIFNGKLIINDSPSCGFDESCSVKINNKTFCIASDLCGEVYVLEKDKYFSLSEEENQKVRSILMKYGFEFPCI